MLIKPVFGGLERIKMEIKITKTTHPKQKPDQSKRGFGIYDTDHMFIMNYDEGEGWHDPRIVPYAPFELDPAAMVLHYAQEVFEGLKAYHTADGSIQLFRPEKPAPPDFRGRFRFREGPASVFPRK